MINYTKPEDRIKQLIDFSIPDFFILSPKLAIELEGFSEECKYWHMLPERINTFITSSRVAFAQNLLDASIFYAIGAVEFSLKAKKVRLAYDQGNDSPCEEELKDNKYNLGKIIHDDNLLTELGVIKFKQDLNDLNELRNGLFHYNFEKLRNAVKKFGVNDFDEWEKNGGFTFITAYIEDCLAIKVYNKCIKVIEKLFIQRSDSNV